MKALSSTDIIGDSLTIINSNYSELQNWTNSIKLSAEYSWEPFSIFYRTYLSEVKKNIAFANENILKWKDMSTLVEGNSAKWIEPLNIIYPEIINTNEINIDYSNLVTIWLNKYFPVKTTNKAIYLETQKAIVSVYLNSIDKKNTSYIVTDSTTCNTSNTVASAPCVIEFLGTVYVGSGTYKCSDVSKRCTVSQNIGCTFPESGNKISGRSISAKINYNFDDVYESKIERLKFKVMNCMWVFESKITD
jgi:hypothetical protein